MVRMRIGERAFWTLPGGGIEPGESPEEATAREVLEETGLSCRVQRPLFDHPYSAGTCTCFLAEVDPQAEPALGFDPEETGLPPEAHMLIGVAWIPLAAMQEDRQVSRVIQTLGLPIPGPEQAVPSDKTG